MTWSDSLSDRYCAVMNIMRSLEMRDFYRRVLDPICAENKILELGCGDGQLSTMIQHRRWTNVDPFTSHPDVVIQKDAVAYLESAEPSSVGVVLCCFALHLFATPDIAQLVASVLEPGGRFINLSLSRRSPLFGDASFNHAFFGRGFCGRPLGPLFCSSSQPSRHSIDIDMSCQDFSQFIQNRSWSNLALMSDAEIKYLLEKVPADLSAITLTIKVVNMTKPRHLSCAGGAD